jgi:branched-chain amino acid transport system ATP-binding protein
MTAEAIAANGITVSFAGVRALTDVQFAVPAGQRRAIIGPNGAGKTTLLDVFDGRVSPSAGVVSLLGRDVTGVSTHVRARRGLARTYQVTTLFDALTVEQNVLLGVAGARRHTRLTFWRALNRIAPVAERAGELLQSWELWHIRDRPVGELSHGQQRLVELVLAVSGDPRVLLLDEPTAGLSEPESALFADAIMGLPARLTVVLVGHDIEMAARLSEVVTVLAGGRVLAEGAPDRVLTDPRVIDSYVGGA